MQLMPSTAAEMGIHDVFDPEQNIAGGTSYLAKMLERFDGDKELALAAYNAGPNAVRRYRGVPPYRETRRYIERVLRFEKHFASGAPIRLS
jgi:soluble lytic murein transglycosylase-like protein